MSKIKIATDSTADIPKQFCEELNISVLLLTILADGKARGERKVISALAERCMKERRPNSNYAIVCINKNTISWYLRLTANFSEIVKGSGMLPRMKNAVFRIKAP